MKRWPAILALGLMTCSQAPNVPVAKTTPTVSASEASSPTAAPSETASPSASVTPAGTPSPDLPLTTVDFSCRLPVVRSIYPNYQGGFITFPGGAFAFDPRGGIRSDDQGVLSTDVTPVLHGSLTTSVGQPFYDLAQGRWIPAGAAQSTPDGSVYAYATWDPSQANVAVVHVVDVASATDRTFRLTMPVVAMGFTVADFDSTGVLLLSNNFEQLPDGVWAMNTSSGAVQRLVEVRHVFAVRGGYAWAAAIDPRDPSPPELRRSGTPSDSVVRVDLRSGAQTVWFYRPGKEVSLTGFDAAARPIVQDYDPNDTTGYTETWLAGDPAGATLIYAGHLYLALPQGDGNRIWFGGGPSVYLYTSSDGLRKVAAVNDLGSNNGQAVVGVCS